MTDAQMLQWFYDRLIHKYKEKPSYDYMIKLKAIIDKMNTPQSIDSGWECTKSPTGFCEYDSDLDGGETCIYCGQPEERK